MFPSLAARETYVAETNLASWKQENVSESSQKHFASRTQILLLKRMFPSLATQGILSGSNVSALMFPSLEAKGAMREGRISARPFFLTRWPQEMLQEINKRVKIKSHYQAKIDGSKVILFL